ncbi:phosphatidylethanolamine N-methyltransferase [Eremomyces bilateralis CBS 781.70]|uniref:Phosphatidylethanolamine N-methyltransferase n=1 Tax=Eremomyces bilateralis CBS 781.70 TaxID=1392243 RepID=A0A6G1FXH0_9PEZI|nr:phosphatidylethanolamine N-methyltransferase [Eremomyces bilateralis CBS 781.70]KAF1810483.1 phosphatidylethanolamine N-methyltransferase [Eremomyces bilateralis CBS 781.70]
MAQSPGDTVDSEGLRARLTNNPAKPQLEASSKSAKDTVQSLNHAEEEKPESGQRTYGRTPNGKVFTVPHTHDMVSQLLSPTQPKNLSDVIVLLILAIHISGLYFLPPSLQVFAFGTLFAFWRLSYNAGIGYLLHIQSNYKGLVTWARRSGIFENPSTGKNKLPWAYGVLKREFETKIPKDYSFEDAPIEYNTWLFFRRVVDLILMCDFVSYCLFAMACAHLPDESVLMTIGRWTAGAALFLFNLWVKLDAHRVVKDFAWYWGDFFFLIDQELTFDGVFEIAPHPMYSIGYAGYYGISLMAASYKVLFISIAAHSAQLAFLEFVENPHIEKTYNPVVPSIGRGLEKAAGGDDIDKLDSESGTGTGTPVPSGGYPSSIHGLLGLNNVDLHRTTDLSVGLLQVYLFLFTVLTPSTPIYQAVFVVNALIWRIWYSFGIGYILNRQSHKKKWTRHFIKYGDGIEEGWRQWKGLYHISMTMFYGSFVAAAYKMYSLPPDWTYGLALLRHVVGIALISLQFWTVHSIYASLGEFGWFFGDFFFDHAPKLTYNGIYRYLNNPERILGLAGIWGLALITWSRAIFLLALLSHLLAVAFLELVERPHMQKLYGESIREDSGISRNIKRSLPKQLRDWQGSIDRALGETFEIVEHFLESTSPRLASGVDALVKESTTKLKSYPAKIRITMQSIDQSPDQQYYSLSIIDTPSKSSGEFDRGSGREGEHGRRPQEHRSKFRPLIFEYGAPIKVRWQAPKSHHRKDWVGLYMVSDNSSREVTQVSSQGRWVSACPGAYDDSRSEDGILVSDGPIETEDMIDPDLIYGEMEFSGDKLWWTPGVFEFRFHHAGKHNVMAISFPFEIKVSKFDDDNAEVDSNGQIRGSIEEALLSVVRNCFNRDPDIAPRTVDESFGSLIERDGKYAKRIVFAVQRMFGIEFAPEVVKADGNVKNLAWRICNAKNVLAPYSMSTSQGQSTPNEIKY